MARCSNCGHDNDDWVPVGDLVQAQHGMATIKQLMAQVVYDCNRIMDIAFGPGGPPKPDGEVRPFKRRRGEHRGGRQ